MIRDYLHYRRLGIGIWKSFTLARARISWVEKLALCIVVVYFSLLGAVILLTGYSFLQNSTHHKTLAEYKLKHQLIQTKAKVQQLELVLIGCLNKEPIRINGRSKECIIREFKEAVDYRGEGA